jgi:ABC-type transport system substrate-binding protein
MAATRPRYGGTLRVEIRETIESADPPQIGPGIADLNAGFTATRWESGRRAVFTADENAKGGRPFLDAVDVQMARPQRERAIEFGRADLVEVTPAYRTPQGQRIWSSQPARVVALVFGTRAADVRVREAIALAVDRAAIHTVLLQRQGEISGALLPQWISGYSFLFPAAADMARARSLVAAAMPAARNLTLAAADRTMAERIALNARDAGLAVTVVPAGAAADVRLAEQRIVSSDPSTALTAIAAAFDLPAPAPAAKPEALYTAERALLEGFRAVPLFHVPDLYAVGPRVRGGPGIGPLGEWRFESLWLEGRP